ncbi:hypothetical protein F4777DRAFT_596659 [Nemania sp. FL0916]|nr:hypothetical protein F4777DRAFT_596659 [Nemania sp. FL0916]
MDSRRHSTTEISAGERASAEYGDYYSTAPNSQAARHTSYNEQYTARNRRANEQNSAVTTTSPHDMDDYYGNYSQTETQPIIPPPVADSDSDRRGSSSSFRTAYGAYHSDYPRQKVSIFQQWREKIDRSVHEHLVKAGIRPLPTFKVNSVVKTTSFIAWQAAETKETKSEHSSPAIPSSSSETKTETESEFRQRIERLRAPPPPAEPRKSESGSRPITSDSSVSEQPTLRRKWSWEVSDESEGEEEAEAAELALLDRIEREQRQPSEYPHSAPAHAGSFQSTTHSSAAGQLVDTESIDSNESLFIGRRRSDIINYSRPSSFFSTDYARRQLADIGDKRKAETQVFQPYSKPQFQLSRDQMGAEEEPQQLLPRAKSWGSQPQDQLDLPSSPPYLVNTEQQLSIVDHRHGLPSQINQDNQAVEQVVRRHTTNRRVAKKEKSRDLLEQFISSHDVAKRTTGDMTFTSVKDIKADQLAQAKVINKYFAGWEVILGLEPVNASLVRWKTLRERRRGGAMDLLRYQPVRGFPIR